MRFALMFLAFMFAIPASAQVRVGPDGVVIGTDRDRGWDRDRDWRRHDWDRDRDWRRRQEWERRRHHRDWNWD